MKSWLFRGGVVAYRNIINEHLDKTRHSVIFSKENKERKQVASILGAAFVSAFLYMGVMTWQGEKTDMNAMLSRICKISLFGFRR